VLAFAFTAAFASRGEARAANEDVSIVDFAFNPSTITIQVGDTVTWTNNGAAPHTVTSTTPAGVLGSPTLNAGDIYSETFNTAGTYTYMCSIHPAMTGSIVVEAAASTATTTATTATATRTTTGAPSAPTTGTGLGDGGGNTAPVIAGLGALVAAGAGVATLALRRKR
jgi:amicyanin